MLENEKEDYVNILFGQLFYGYIVNGIGQFFLFFGGFWGNFSFFNQCLSLFHKKQHAENIMLY